MDVASLNLLSLSINSDGSLLELYSESMRVPQDLDQAQLKIVSTLESFGLSKATDRNLLPYYEIWHILISEAARQKINSLNLNPWLASNYELPNNYLNPDYLDAIGVRWGM